MSNVKLQVGVDKGFKPVCDLNTDMCYIICEAMYFATFLSLLALYVLSWSIPLLQLLHTARGTPLSHEVTSKFPLKTFPKIIQIFQPLNLGAAPAGIKISASALPTKAKKCCKMNSQGSSGSVATAVPRNCKR